MKKPAVLNPIVGGMKEARLLLPHRSNSVIEKWIQKEQVSATEPEGGPGTGRPYRFTLHQYWDLMFVDQLSALGVLKHGYRGPNRIDPSGRGPQILELFEYGPGASKEDVLPRVRSREHAIKFYRRFGRHVIVKVALMVYGPDRISGVAQTRSRTKMGTIYHNITYIPEDVRVYDAPNGPDPYRILTEEVAEWRQGKYVGHGPTLCLISIDLLARQVASVLGL